MVDAQGACAGGGEVNGDKRPDLEVVVGVRRERASEWDTLNRALDQRDTLALEVQGARAIIAALVAKFGPVDLSPTEILRAADLTIDVVTGPHGFSYRARAR